MSGVWLAMLLTVLVLAGQAFAAAAGEIVRFDLDGRLDGTVEGRQAQAELGPAAEFVASVEGEGIRPADGFAVRIPAGAALARPAGTMTFRFCLSRTDLFQFKSPDSLILLDSPVLRIEYSAAKLFISVPAAEGPKREPQRIQFTHFKADRWYHLAVAWDAQAGTIDVYLNGVHQEYPPAHPWRLGPAAGPLQLGGAVGDLKIAVDSVIVYDDALDGKRLAETLVGRAVDPAAGEGRMDLAGSIDLAGRKPKLVYEADFDKPLSVVTEADLFEGDRRVRTPEGFDWVLEGGGRAWTEAGRLHMQHAGPDESLVLWLARTFDDDFLLEFGFSPGNPECGLTIIFFCANRVGGGTIFDSDMPMRGGLFPKYHSDRIACYHTSYWATDPNEPGYRGTSNLRKNPGHRLVAIGSDHIAGKGAGPHQVRLCKIGRRIQLEANGKLAVVWDDDGTILGPSPPGGYIGLRQMRHTQAGSYTHFRVYELQVDKPL